MGVIFRHPVHTLQMAMRLRPAGLSDSESDDEQYHNAFIDVEIGGQMVMLSKKTTYYLIHLDKAIFSKCLCYDAWNKDILFHTKVNGSHKINESIHIFHQLGICRSNYLN